MSIEKHAAERAALVAQLERSREAHGLMIIRCTKAEQALSGEKALHECTAADAQKAINGLEAQVAELTRERDEARGNHALEQADRQRFESEVTRLTEALAQAEAEAELNADEGLKAEAWAEKERATRYAAEARVRELEARVRELEDDVSAAHQYHANAVNAKQQQLAAANALLERACPQSHNEAHIRKWWADREAHLSAQPTAPTDHERAVLEAAEAWYDADINDPDPTEEALRVAVLARREAKR